jgi:hypothetical protein
LVMSKNGTARVRSCVLLDHLESRTFLSAAIAVNWNAASSSDIPADLSEVALNVKPTPGLTKTRLAAVVAPALPPIIPGDGIPLARAANPALPIVGIRVLPTVAANAPANVNPTLPSIDLGHLPTVRAYDWHTQVINGVLNIWAPNPADLGSTFSVTSTTALFGASGTPTLADIHQGSLADCYLLAAGGSLARTHPDILRSEILNDPGGGWAVMFQIYSPSTGGYTPIEFHTDNTLSYSQAQSVTGAVWPLVLEKAFAAFRSWNGINSINTLASVNWGSPTQALTQLGATNNQLYIGLMSDQTFYNTLQTALSAGEPILYQTSNNASTMVSAHVYVITGVSTDAGGTRWITTYNPWGFYDTRTETDLRNNGISTVVIGTA